MFPLRYSEVLSEGLKAAAIVKKQAIAESSLVQQKVVEEEL
jgi:hypothetical protein